MATSVLLLRAPGSPPDKYESAFKTHGYFAISVPVLETVLVNQSDLSKIVEEGPKAKQLSGVIITSARSCEAWRAVVDQLVSERVTAHSESDWSSLPFYVVGDATATALADIKNIPSSGGLSPRDIRGGAESGTSEKLAHFILEDLARHAGKRLLYLTGDKNRDTLPTIMEEGGVGLLNLQVYETVGSSRFEDDLLGALSTAPSDAVWWIIYFAPSAADFVTPILNKHLKLQSANDGRESDPSDVHIAAIGPTTSAFLHNKVRLMVQVTSPKPTPEALAEAIKEFDISRVIQKID